MEQPDRPAPEPSSAVPSDVGVARQRVLLLEPDDLMHWSLVMYLQRWFTVVSVETCAAAARLVSEQEFAGLVLSDQLASPAEVLELQRRASRGAPVPTVRMVAGPGHPGPAGPSIAELEKPFELALLAQHLGVSPAELPRR